MTPAVEVEVADPSGVGDVRRRCTELAGRLGFDETAAGRVALIATELASNLQRHAAGERRVIAQAVDQDGQLTVELLGIDGGPGIGNIAHALRDGFSTSTTPGTGLGAIRRLADDFELHSSELGTVVLARVRAHPPVASGSPPAAASPLQVSGLALAKSGEPVSGDAWAVEHDGERSTIFVVDGLGHGPDAAQAALQAVRVFHHSSGAAPAERVQALHEQLHGTRGAAVAVAEIRPRRGQVLYAGLGNIAGAVVTPDGSRHMVSHDGIAGHIAARIHEYSYDWPHGALLVMHSDGMSQRWDLARYPGLILRDPSVIAAVLLRDCSRRRDDVTVVVAREAE